MKHRNPLITQLARLGSLLLLLAIGLSSAAQHRHDPVKPRAQHPGQDHSHDHEGIDALLNRHDQRITFMKNGGQFGSTVLYRADFPLGQAVATDEGMVVTAFDPIEVDKRTAEGFRIEEEMAQGLPMRELQWRKRGHAWRHRFVGASSEMRIEARDKHAELTNYFVGDRSALDVSSYQEVWYTGIYPNIDARYYPAADGSLEYDVIVMPGGDPSEVAIAHDGIERMRVNEKGELVIETILGEMAHPAPYVYQRNNGREMRIDATYKVDGNVLRFALGAYDRTQPLVIDPIAMRWATWINTNSSSDNHGHCIWVDPTDGAIYVVARVTGTTDQITPGAFDETANGALEMIVGKYLEPAAIGGSGTRVWQTYIGGNGDDNPYAMEQGPDGNLYITGQTSSTNFPLLGGTAFSGSSLNQQAQSDIDVFVLKINTAGNSIKAAVVGGNGADNNFDVRLAANGDVFVAGSTTSTNLLTLNPGSGASNTNNGGSDVFLFRINQDLSSLVWMRNYGGGATDRASIMLHDPATGDLFVGGNTSSTNFPTASPRQGTRGGNTAGFLQRLNGATAATSWSSYFSSAASQNANLLCMEFNTSKDELFFGGVTSGLNSANITAGSYDTSHNGNNDFYVGRMTVDQTFIAGTYIGGSGNEVNMMGLNTDLNNDAYVFGYSASTNFPVSASPNVPLQTTNQGSNDKVFFKLKSSLNQLEFSTYYGGTSDDYDPVGERGIKFNDCRIYTIVTAQSNNIPLTQGALNTTKNSPTNRYEPGLVVWANPPDLLGNSITYQGVSICPGATPGDITGSEPSYSLPTIVRNNSASGYPAFASAATYQWQISLDSLNWTDINGATGQNLPGSLIGAITQDTYIRRIIGGDACILAGAADQVVKVQLMTAGGSVTDALCNGAATGSIAATADGQAPFTYVWSDGQTTETAINLAAGPYSVIVTDFNGCSASANFVVGQPAPLSADVNTMLDACATGTGSATATGTGGTPGYGYLWSTGTTGPNLTNVSAGAYSVQVTDFNQCSAVVLVNIDGTLPPSANAGDDLEINCTTGTSVQLNGSSQTPGVNFSWTGPGIVNGGGSANPTVNAPGTYTLTVTNPQTGCTATDQVDVTVNTTVPGAQAAGGTITCSNECVMLTGTGNGSFAWSGPSNFNSTEQNPTVCAPGTYTLVVTGSNGCTSTATAEVGADFDAPQATLTSTLIGCEGEPATVSYTSTSAIASAEWYNANGLVGSGSSISTSTPGAYTLILTALNGCTNEFSIEVQQNTDCDKDCEPLILTCPSDITVACADDFSPFGLGGEPVFNKNKDDECPDVVQAWWSDVILSNCPYVIRRTWHAVGSDGSTETCTQYITVIDDVAPIFYNVPDGINIACDADMDAITTPDVTAYDECTKVDVAVYHNMEIVQGNCAGNYSIIHTWTSQDQCGNIGTATWTIEVIDNVPPVISCPVEDISVECKDVPEPTDKCEASDNCSAEVTITVEEEKGEQDEDGKYVITRTYIAIDECGNTSTQVQLITVWCDKKEEDGKGPVQAGIKMVASAWPNPFREESSISITAQESGLVQVIVTDLQGRVVSELYNGHVEAGAMVVLPFRPAERNGGAYLYRVRLNGEELMGRILAQP